MIFTNKTISLVTRCMNRADQLRQALPTWTTVPEIDRFVIVDWSSDPPLVDLSSDSRVQIVRKNDETVFDKPRAWNLGLQQVADIDYIFLIDCDVKILQSPLPLILPDKPEYYYVFSGVAVGLFGTCIITKEQLQATGGYDESTGTRRVEDQLFYNRLDCAGFKRKFVLTRQHLQHINHAR